MPARGPLELVRAPRQPDLGCAGSGAVSRSRRPRWLEFFWRAEAFASANAPCVASSTPIVSLVSSNALGWWEYMFGPAIMPSPVSKKSRNDSMLTMPVHSTARCANSGHRPSDLRSGRMSWQPVAAPPRSRNGQDRGLRNLATC